MERFLKDKFHLCTKQKQQKPIIMKKITLLFSVIATLLIVSCGKDGIDGRDGVDGQDGVNIQGKVIDIQGTFSESNDYGFRHEFGNNIEVLDTDVVLVYLLWNQVNGSDGQPIDVWRQLPQNIIIDGKGLLQYNYEHTFLDVDFFLEADFDLGTLTAEYTDNQVFRIAVLPAESLTGKSSLDRSDIRAVLSYLDVAEKDIPKIKVN